MEALEIIKQIDSNILLLKNMDEFVGKTVIITINPFNDLSFEKSTKSLRGALKKFADENLISQEKNAWADAVKEKYDS